MWRVDQGDKALADPPAPAQAVRLPVRDENGPRMSLDAKHVRWIFFDVGDTLLDERESMFDWCGQVAAELTRRGSTTAAADVWAARERAYADFAPDVLGRILENLSLPASQNDVYNIAKYQH